MPDVASIGADERVGQAVGGTTTEYRWDMGWNVVNEEDAFGDLTRTHVVDSPLAEVAGVLADVAGTNPATTLVYHMIQVQSPGTGRIPPVVASCQTVKRYVET